MDSWALTIQTASCFFMTGVILIIQRIHYPCFAQIKIEEFSNFHGQHTKALGSIAGPAMILELVSALWLSRWGEPWWVLNAIGVCSLWALTFLVSVPAHNRLAKGFDQTAWRRLVSTNWLRTLLWGVRSLGFLFAMGAGGFAKNLLS